jgi:hypothetical protein
VLDDGDLGDGALAAELGNQDWVDQLDDESLDELARWLDAQGAG